MKTMRKTIYTIYEYNTKSKTYKELGTIMASSTVEARAQFIEESKWRKRQEVVLLVQLPNCK